MSFHHFKKQSNISMSFPSENLKKIEISQRKHITTSVWTLDADKTHEKKENGKSRKKKNNIYEKAIKSKQHLFGCPENS